MAQRTLMMSVDCKLLVLQVQQLGGLARLLPKRRAQRFERKALRVLHALRCSEVPSNRLQPARGTGDLRIQVRALGMDELIAAALRAVDGKRAGRFLGHGGPHAK